MREIPARFSSCFPCAHSVKSDGFWKGGGSPRARARGGKSELRRARCRVTQARSAGIDAGGTFQSVSTDSATEKKPPLRLGVSVARVKRWGKSPPLQERSRRHGKPHREQGPIGNLRSGPLQAQSRTSVPPATANPGQIRGGIAEAGRRSYFASRVPGFGRTDKWSSPPLTLTRRRGRQNSAYSLSGVKDSRPPSARNRAKCRRISEGALAPNATCTGSPVN